ncbi:hypothetical protein [Pseudobacillus wudalianchiensis]|uniref:Uncharacterized protein n=1 Tax=Pseudobacillus wudalianchiensis TaxID=1743143 RepID=A0A1B9AN11_9BACI|nr:hypothetical protein [Bacillus wudalianchiensis]OCA85249.1 hypothetical protein A8F95_11285 [Bacillus wudalianchiensis]
MCNLCNGTYVATNDIGFGWMKQPCPKCGPMPGDIQKKRQEEFDKRLEEAMRLAELVGKDAS